MPTPERLAKFQKVAQQRQQGIVIIEDVYDPHNAEAVIRSCDAFGIQEVWFIFVNQPSFNPAKVGKATSSFSNKWLDYRIFKSTEECLQTAKKEGYEIIATILDEESESLFDFEFSHPKPAILLGNEKEGLSSKAIEMADRKMIIPMRGFVQSFNLSVTASMFLFELTRQRIKKGIEQFALSNSKITQLVNSFQER